MLPKNTTILVATQPVNMNLSFDRLAGIVRSSLQQEPRDPILVLFHNRRGTHVKLLWHDTSGYCIFYQRLDKGAFRFPLTIPPHAQKVLISKRELLLLLEGIDMDLIRAAQRRAKERGSH